MKKVIVFTLLALAVICNPDTSFSQAFKEGDNIIGVGIGFGSSYGGFGYGSESPGFSALYEHGNWTVGGPCVISLGGYLGYKSYSYDYLSYYSESVSYTVIGVRSAYHYNGINSMDWDVYGGAMISYNIASYSFTSHDPNYAAYSSGGADSQLRFSLFVGGRYYVSEKVSLFAELGYGISNFTLGAAFRL